MFPVMKALALASLMAVLGVTPALAQARPWAPYGTTGIETQRYAIEQQRQQAEASEALARQQALQTRLTLMELQARRIPSPTPDGPTPAPGSLEQARAARQAATARRQSTTQGVGQIDSWLDRRPQ